MPALQSPPSTITLLEDYARSPSIKVDTEAKVLRGVKILSHESEHGYRYTEEAMRKALPLYEGVPANIDHIEESGQRRRLAERFGWIAKPRLEADGVYGDLHYLESNQYTPMILEAAARNPLLIALSHHAEGKPVRRGDEMLVEEITKVWSVDVVCDGATNRGLFEKHPPMPTPKKKVKDILEAAVTTDRQKSALKEMEPMVGETEMEAPPAESSAEDQMKAAFRGMVVAAFDDESLDAAATVKKIKEILAAQEKLLAGDAPAEPAAEAEGEGEEDEEKPEEEQPVAESKRIGELAAKLAAQEAKVALMERRESVRKLCAKHKVASPSETLMEALVKLDDKQAVTLLEEIKAGTGPALPSGARSTETRPAALNSEELYREGMKRLGREPAAAK